MNDDGAFYHVRIRDLPADDRPRERLLRSGPASLSTAELLAILIRTGTAAASAIALGHSLIARHGLEGLQRLDAAELAAVHGMGPAKAAQVLAALELGRRAASLQPEARPVITEPRDVVALLGAELAPLEQEELRVLLLSTRNHVLAVRTVYRGSVNAASVRISEVLRDAIRHNAPAVIAVHNHPSGDPAPSPADIQMTQDLVAAGRLLDIDVVDHIIIGAGGAYRSLRADHLLEPKTG